jgi:3-oxoacyl-[acyl-carrier-protein] synthase-1
VERLGALALLALEEATAGVPLRGAVPVVVCAPTLGRGEGERLLARISSDAAVPADAKASRVLLEGRSAAISGLKLAAGWLASGRVPACLVVGVDSLIGKERVQALLEAAEVLFEGQEEGYVPGEAAAALLLTPFGDPEAGTALVGLAAASEPGAKGATGSLTGEGYARAATGALAGARLAPGLLEALCHECTGLQKQFEEILLARGRAPLDACQSERTLTASLAAGEVGAASGLLSIAMMSHLVSHGVTEGPVMSLLRGEGGERGAAIVASAGRKRRT